MSRDTLRQWEVSSIFEIVWQVVSHFLFKGACFDPQSLPQLFLHTWGDFGTWSWAICGRLYVWSDMSKISSLGKISEKPSSQLWSVVTKFDKTISNINVTIQHQGSLKSAAFSWQFLHLSCKIEQGNVQFR